MQQVTNVAVAFSGGAVDIATDYGSEFESWWGRENSLLHIVQIESGARYLQDTGGHFLGVKAAVMWNSPLTPN